jgi:hypothetical protein
MIPNSVFRQRRPMTDALPNFVAQLLKVFENGPLFNGLPSLLRNL